MYKVNESLAEIQLNRRKDDIKFLAFFGVLAVIVYVIVALNTCVYFNVRVKQSSMEPTVYEDDMLVANMLKNPKVGDIVIIDNMEEYLLIKRVIAVGGQKVEIKDGGVYVDGQRLREDYLPEGTVTEPKSMGQYEWVVPDGEIYFLGDNRSVSRDSRSMGTCKLSDITGVVEPWSVSTKGIRNFFYGIYEGFLGIFGVNTDVP